MTKHRLKFLAPVAVLVIAAGVFLWSQSSAQGTITSSYTNPAKSLPDRQLTGKYFALTYSGHYAVKQTTSTDPRDLELYSLIADTTYEKKLVIAVSLTHGGQLSENSAYNLRHAHPETYKEEVRQVNGHPVTVTTKSDGSEETAFIVSNGKVASLVFGTEGSIDNLSAEFDRTLNSFRWR